MDISIILAAGEGTRMKSKMSKVLHKIGGKPLVKHVLDACTHANIDKNIIIVGHGKEQVIEQISHDGIIFKEQPIYEGAPYGTGFAVSHAMDEIEEDSTVVILCGDTPLITGETINELKDFHNKGNYDGTVLTAVLDDATGYGRIVKDESGELVKIVEQKDASKEEQSIREVNSGMYCFKGGALKHGLKKITNDNSQNEYYLTDLISILKDDNYKVGACIMDDSQEIIGVNNRVQLSLCEEIIRMRINEKLMLEGVSIIDPRSTYIEDGVTIGIDTVIYPGTVLEGKTKIGENCIIRSNTRIFNSTIHDNVEIESSLIEESIVEGNCHIGPYAHLRPNSHLQKNVNIGNFVEIKNSTVGENSKAGHLAYVGDADIGKNANIGCGVIFVNYNGVDKFRSKIGDNTFIGSNSNIVAPVEVQDWAYIAAGSTITKNVGEADLSIARAEQVNKPKWVEKKGLRKDI